MPHLVFEKREGMRDKGVKNWWGKPQVLGIWERPADSSGGRLILMPETSGIAWFAKFSTIPDHGCLK